MSPLRNNWGLKSVCQRVWNQMMILIACTHLASFVPVCREKCWMVWWAGGLVSDISEIV